MGTSLSYSSVLAPVCLNSFAQAATSLGSCGWGFPRARSPPELLPLLPMRSTQAQRQCWAHAAAACSSALAGRQVLLRRDHRLRRGDRGPGHPAGVPEEPVNSRLGWLADGACLWVPPRLARCGSRQLGQAGARHPRPLPRPGSSGGMTRTAVRRNTCMVAPARGGAGRPASRASSPLAVLCCCLPGLRRGGTCNRPAR